MRYTYKKIQKFPGFPLANKSWKQALEEGDEEQMDKLEAGYHAYFEDKRDDV